MDRSTELVPYFDWRFIADEAESWFRNEMVDRFRVYFEPTQKSLKRKEEGISQIKDIFLNNRIVASDRCVKWLWELMHYRKDKHGKIPKKNDHQIDNTRYLLNASSYSMNKEYEEEIPDEDRRFVKRKIGDYFPGLNDLGEPTMDDWMNVE